MAATLEEGLARLNGRPIRIQALRRQFLPSSSSFRTERLDVTPERGRRLRVFFKDLNPAHLMPKARRVRRLDLEAGQRELRMYQSLLSPERFGTLRLYASRWEPEHGRVWIFLEDGAGTLLHDDLYLPGWTSAARWAARFHAATRDLPDAQTRFLPQYDRAHYRRCVERVEQILPALDPGERAVVDQGLACFAERIEWLSALPRCVIHGQYFGENIILRRARRAQRIVVIDWETAALGPGTFDLVSLTSGKWTARQRQAMWSAYVEQYQVATGQPVDGEAFRQELAGVSLYQALEWLAWWGKHRRLSKHFANFMRELRAVLDTNFARAVGKRLA
jgi:aminoglycoside phosphotransferase (APT) family kinase protein